MPMERKHLKDLSHVPSEENGELQLGGICLVAGLGNKEMREGTFDYYMREPIVKMKRKALHR